MAPPACAPGPGFPELTAAFSEETSDAISKQEGQKHRKSVTSNPPLVQTEQSQHRALIKSDGISVSEVERFCAACF